MSFSISLNSENGRVNGKEDVSQMTIDTEKNSGGLANVKQGQQITGTVISVGEQVTLDFDGQKVSTSKEVLNKAVPGERKTFEVIKTSGTEIELRLIEGSASEQRKTIKAAMIQETDWESVLAQKSSGSVQAEKDQQTKELMNKLQNISAKFTTEDCYTLEKEGFPLESLSINGLYEAISRVKTEALIKKNEEKAIEANSTSNPTQEDIVARLKAENLPATTQNISNIKKALALSEAVVKMDDNAMRYLISREAQPTIENIYKACYSGSTKSKDKTEELPKEAWSELEAQVKAVITDAGYEVNEANLKDARWLIENKLPLTEKTFSYKKELGELKQNTDKEKVLNRIIDGLKNGTAPGEVTLTEPADTTLNKVITEVSSISEAAITYAVYTDSQLTIKKLAAIQEDMNAGRISIDSVTVRKRISEAKVAEQEPKQVEVTQGEPVQNIAAREEAVKKEPMQNRTVQTEVVQKETIQDRTVQAETVQKEPTQNRIVQSEEEQKGPTQNRMVQAEAVQKAPIQYRTTQSEVTQKEPIQVETVQSGTTEAENNTENPSGENSGGQEKDSKGNKDYRYEEIKAQRQLEEIRLKMTLEAARVMEKKGISVDTQELEKVVEELRRLENSYYSKLLSEAEVPASEEALQTLKDTTLSVERLRTVPSYVLGSTLSQQSTQTIPSLLSEGNRLQAELQKAGTAYETLMTVPNAEYGDSIRKAFGNMASLLSEMNIEDTPENQRAVRILGYNQMEISADNINSVKAYDKEVTSLIDNLHPAVTVRMVKEGINPLNTPIEQLNNEIERMKEEQGITSEDKFSTYLQKLEKSNAISAEERKAYIGIYRLLYNVEKSDGAALGSVIRSGREVTLSNLLTAVQNGRKGRLEAVINDEFGTLTELSRTKESISEQLSIFTGGSARQFEQSKEQLQKEERLEQQTQYINRIVKQITQEMSPEKLNQLQQSSQAAGLTQTDVAKAQNRDNTAQNQSSASTTQNQSGAGTSHTGSIWEGMKDTPLEKLLQQLQNSEDTQDNAKELYSQKVEQLRQLSRNSEQSIRFLNDYQITATPQSIMIANHLLSNGESPIVKLLKRQQENSIENYENGLKELSDLSDKLIDKSSVNEAYETLEANARTALGEACSQETIDSRKLAELKSIGQQMTFLRTLASKEYYQIPIETSKGITNINLTILRGSGNSGCVSVAVKSEQLGDMKAEFSLKEQKLKGFINSDSKPGIEKLQGSMGEFEKTMSEDNITLKQMDFAIKRRENDTYSYQNPETGESTTMGNDIERKLYRIAKAFVQAVSTAESSDGTIQRAVS